MATKEVEVIEASVGSYPAIQAQRSTILSLLRGRTQPLIYSRSNQAPSVGGMFLANAMNAAL